MTDTQDPHLSPLLQRAVRQLSAAPEPSDLWRQRLLHRVAGLEPRHDLPLLDDARTWSFRAGQLVAAALVCVLLGGAATYAAMRARPPRIVAAAASTTAAVQRVRFTLVAPRAATVAVVGDFNDWNPAAALPLRRLADGVTWEVVVPLSPGRYVYAFVVDGALARDPEAPRAGDDDFGSPSSVVLVRGS